MSALGFGSLVCCATGGMALWASSLHWEYCATVLNPLTLVYCKLTHLDTLPLAWRAHVFVKP